MPGAARTTGWPRAGTLIAAVAAGIALGAAGAVAASALSDETEPNLLFGGLDVPLLEGRTDLERMTVGLTLNNNGTSDFRVTDVRIPGWDIAEPEAVDTTIPAGRWASMSFDLVVDCSASAPELNVEVVGAEGAAVTLERDALAGFATIHLRACVEQGVAGPDVTPAIEAVTARTDGAGGVMHVDIDVGHEASSELDFQLAAVTGHASGFTVELADRLTELDAGATATVTTEWRVRDCGGAAGTTGTGTPDRSSSGNFDGLVLHLYWEDPARTEPIRIDLPVDPPPEVIAALARFAVAECGADGAGT